MSNEADEKTFLVGFKRDRVYGTTPSSYGGRHRRTFSKVIEHNVEPSETLQGIALKYNVSMVELRRINKLWSADMIHLREILLIPVYSDEQSPPSSLSPSHSVSDVSPVDTILSSLSKKPSSLSMKDNPRITPVPEMSISDFLCRIDSSIKETTKNVKRIEQQTSIDVIESPGGSSADRGLFDPSTNVSDSMSKREKRSKTKITNTNNNSGLVSDGVNNSNISNKMKSVTSSSSSSNNTSFSSQNVNGATPVVSTSSFPRTPSKSSLRRLQHDTDNFYEL